MKHNTYLVMRVHGGHIYVFFLNAIKQKSFHSPSAGFRFDYSLIVHHASFELQMRFINTLMQKLIGKQLAMHYFTAKVLSEYGKHSPMLAYQILKPNKEAQQ